VNKTFGFTSLSSLALADIYGDVTLGANELWLGTQSGADGTTTLA
jgi:hypothetical protein